MSAAPPGEDGTPQGQAASFSVASWYMCFCNKTYMIIEAGAQPLKETT
jgi:hypothetical protein